MKLKILLASLVLLLILPHISSAAGGAFTFTLPSSARTSAGVYKTDGTLVRTLWSGEQYQAGTFTKSWDGLQDDGTTAPTDTYSIKVLSNNVSYEWEGARIGNTSTALTGSTKYHMFEPFSGMLAKNQTMYVAAEYNEGNPSQVKFQLNNPQSKTWVTNKNLSGIQHLTADNQNIYWSVYDPYNIAKTLVFATKISDDSEVNFTNGVVVNFTYGTKYNSAIGISQSANSVITGLAVQKNGNYLFVARSGLNQLLVLNKSTGQLVKTLSIQTVDKLSIDTNDNLWAVHDNNILEKYTVNSDGSLQSTGLTINSVIKPGAIAISPDNSTIIVADMEISQQVVKGFNTTTGQRLWTLGELGGYASNAKVSDYKFYFSDTKGVKSTAITFQDDGSFWIIDAGNLRAQHYNPDRTFKDRIMYLKNNYNVSADKVDPTRVFVDFLEFKIDYSKPLDNGINGSWTLVNNWGSNFGSQYDSFAKLKKIYQLSNGRTYAMVRQGVFSYLVELVNGGVIRYVDPAKINFGQRSFLYDDGSKIIYGAEVVGSPIDIKKYPLIGFDSSNDPMWSTTPEILASLSQIGSYDPYNDTNKKEILTDSNNVIFFQNNRVDGADGKNFHLGAIKKGTNKWLWKTARGTPNYYSGEFPKDGRFDNGNGVVYAGGSAIISGDNIFWNYHGEFWKQSQTNMWNQVDGNTGLMVGQFGTTGINFENGTEAPAQMAGNVFGGTIVTVGGNTYLYHNDESAHGAIHRWKINGLNTINIQNGAYSSNENIEEKKGINLMYGLGRNVPLTNSNGWNRGTEPNDSSWNVGSGFKVVDPFLDPDVIIYYRVPSGPNSTRSVTRDLGSNSNISFWELTGKINWEGNIPNLDNNTSFIEVLDKDGKIISQLYMQRNYTNDPNPFKFRANDKIISEGSDSLSLISRKSQPFIITMQNGILKFNYANFGLVSTTNVAQVGADMKNPKTLRIIFKTGNTQPENKEISLQELRFNSTTQNTPPTASAGSLQTITLPTSTVTLSGSAIDIDGTIATHTWSQTSGPITSTITSPSAYQTTVTNLTTAGTYTFRLTATDNGGLTVTSDITIIVSVPAITAPSSPTSIVATPGNAQATVSFTAPTNTGTAPITSYIATSSPAAITKSGTSSPLIITGLSNNVAYTFTVKAITSVGSSLASSVSNTVTPMAPVVVTGPEPIDTTPPIITPTSSTINLPSDTTQTTLSLTTNEASSCRYATSASALYASMTPFTTTGGTTHTTIVTGLAKGTSTYFIRCADTSNNTTVAQPITVIIPTASQSTGGGSSGSPSSSGSQPTTPQTPTVTPPTTTTPGIPPTTTQLTQPQQQETVSTVSVQVKGLNVRSEPNTTGKVVGQLAQYSEGTVIPGTETPDGWVKARFSNGVEGYVNKKYAPIKVSSTVTTPVPSSSGSTKVQVKVKGLNVRSLPNTTGKVLGKLSLNTQGTIIPGTETTDGWVKATFPNNIVGYVNKKYAPIVGTPSSIIRINVKGLNVRSLPNTTGKVLGQFPMNTQATIIPGTLTTDGWVKATFPRGIVGWVNMKYVR